QPLERGPEAHPIAVRHAVAAPTGRGLGVEMTVFEVKVRRGLRPNRRRDRDQHTKKRQNGAHNANRSLPWLVKSRHLATVVASVSMRHAGWDGTPSHPACLIDSPLHPS